MSEASALVRPEALEARLKMDGSNYKIAWLVDNSQQQQRAPVVEFGRGGAHEANVLARGIAGADIVASLGAEKVAELDVDIVLDPIQAAWVKKLEARVKDLVVANSREWFGQPFTNQEISKKFKSCLSKAAPPAFFDPSAKRDVLRASLVLEVAPHLQKEAAATKITLLKDATGAVETGQGAAWLQPRALAAGGWKGCAVWLAVEFLSVVVRSNSIRVKPRLRSCTIREVDMPRAQGGESVGVPSTGGYAAPATATSSGAPAAPAAPGSPGRLPNSHDVSAATTAAEETESHSLSGAATLQATVREAPTTASSAATPATLTGSSAAASSADTLPEAPEAPAPPKRPLEAETGKAKDREGPPPPKRSRGSAKEEAWSRAFGESKEGACGACDKKLSIHDVEFGCRVPPCQGGAQGVDNKAPLCHRCCRSKGNRPLEAFAAVVQGERQRILAHLDDIAQRPDECLAVGSGETIDEYREGAHNLALEIRALGGPVEKAHSDKAKAKYAYEPTPANAHFPREAAVSELCRASGSTEQEKNMLLSVAEKARRDRAAQTRRQQGKIKVAVLSCSSSDIAKGFDVISHISARAAANTSRSPPGGEKIPATVDEGAAAPPLPQDRGNIATRLPEASAPTASAPDVRPS